MRLCLQDGQKCYRCHGNMKVYNMIPNTSGDNKRSDWSVGRAFCPLCYLVKYQLQWLLTQVRSEPALYPGLNLTFD